MDPILGPFWGPVFSKKRKKGVPEKSKKSTLKKHAKLVPIETPFEDKNSQNGEAKEHTFIFCAHVGYMQSPGLKMGPKMHDFRYIFG